MMPLGNEFQRSIDEQPTLPCAYCGAPLGMTSTVRYNVVTGRQDRVHAPTCPQVMTEYRDGRNFVRVGDLVKVAPSRPGRRNGFVSRVRRIHFDEVTLQPTGVDVVDGTGATRTVRPERITRKREPKD